MCRPESESVNAFDTGQSSEDQSVDYAGASALFSDGGIQEFAYGEKKKSIQVKDRATKPYFQEFRLLTFKTNCYGKSAVLAFVLIHVLSGASSTLVEGPKNAVIFQLKWLESVEMACISDCQCNLKFFVNKGNDSEKQDLYDGYFLHSYANSYCTVIAVEPGKVRLNLTNKPEAAQTYTCLEPGTLTEASADLIWIGDPIHINSSSEDLTNLTCGIKFTGNWAPIIEWKERSRHGEKLISNGGTALVFNQFVTSTLILPKQKCRRNYTCIAKFDISGKPNATTATNAPDDIPIWTFIDSQDETMSNSVVSIGTTLGIAFTVPIVIVAVFVIGRRHFIRRNRKRALDEILRRAYLENGLNRMQAD